MSRLSLGLTAFAAALMLIVLAQRHEAAALKASLKAAEIRIAQAEACDQALLDGALFALRTACSTEVKTLFAQREAETARADSLAALLAEERRQTAAAIDRAETRARDQTERTLRAEAALADAPRRGDLLILDADRLRELRGDPAG